MNASRKRKPRWWAPVLLVAIAFLTIVGMEIAQITFRAHISAALIILTALLLALWSILFTGLPSGWRLAGLGVLMATVLSTAFVIKNYTRVEGSYSGAGLPRLVWKWAPAPDSQLPAITPLESEATPQGDWAQISFPEFLGSGRTNAVPGTALAPDWPSIPPQEVWRQPIGAGWSGFAVAEGRAVTQEQRGEHELVVCYNLLDGQVLWAHTNQVRFTEELGGPGPRATPTLHQNRVYAMGAAGTLDCLELSTGERIWTRETLKNPGADNLMWGKSNSPLIVEDRVVVTGGGMGPLLMAFHRDTGAPAWEGGKGSASYASPVLATLAGREQILIVNAQSVTGHDPSNGAVLWHYDWPGSTPKVSQPIAVAPDMVFISAGYGIGTVLLQLVPSEENGSFSITEVWRNRNMKTKFTNVAIHNGFVYGLDDGILACIELATGKRQWKDGRYGHGQLLLVDDVLVIQSEPGAIALVAADPDQHRELGRWPALKSKTWNNPAFAGPYLLLRNDREALCLKFAAPSPPGEAAARHALPRDPQNPG
jgi:outer membrane protein assembly factor BamB